MSGGRARDRDLLIMAGFSGVESRRGGYEVGPVSLQYPAGRGAEEEGPILRIMADMRVMRIVRARPRAAATLGAALDGD